ncbi:Predicted phospholipase [Ceraceosorus bombacis]|uniref:Predicted phospholipase n=1 Tax=Ceraceosorus bombacis TaxID=401625 RepID=A0A0P1BHU5_9BASI|nr:Predicted phospholipase [Ceraceosorus bombacis]
MQPRRGERHPPSAGTYEPKHRRNYRGYVPNPGDEVAHVPAGISPDQLWEGFISQRRPCVIDGPIQDAEFKAVDWTDLDRLKQRAGSSRVKIEPIHPSGRFGTAMERQKVPFGLYLDMMQDSELAGSYYLTTQYESEDGEDSQDEEDEASREAVEDATRLLRAKSSNDERAGRLKRPRSASAESERDSDVDHRPTKVRNRTDSVPARRTSHTSASSALQTLSPDSETSSSSSSSAPTSYTADESVEDLDPPLPPPMSALAGGLPLPVPKILGGLVLQQCNMWMGACTEPKSSGLHHDHHDNLYMLLSGRKRFLLWPPIAHFWLQPRGRLEGMHQNGLLTYVPRGELPSWHAASNRQQLRADGLPEAESAHWRIKARERALEEANERAAQLSGEAHRPASRRKGKGKQTPEQVLAMERLAAARLHQEYIRRLESGDSFVSREDERDVESDLEEDEVSSQSVSPTVARRALAARADAELDDASDDDGGEHLLAQAARLGARENIEKMHYDAIAVPFIAHALAPAEERIGLPPLIPHEVRKSDGTRDDSSDISDASIDQRELNAAFLEPLLEAVRRAGNTALDLDTAMIAIRQGYQAVGLSAEGLALEDDSDESGSDDGASQMSEPRPCRSSPLRIPPGMLPGGLLGRPDGTGGDEEHEFEEYDDYLAEAQETVHPRDIEAMLGRELGSGAEQGLLDADDLDDTALEQAMFAEAQAHPEQREALVARLHEIATEQSASVAQSRSDLASSGGESEESEIGSDIAEEGDDEGAVLGMASEQQDAIREQHLVQQLKYGLAKSDFAFLDEVMDDAQAFCIARSSAQLPITDDLRILVAAVLQIGAMEDATDEDERGAETTSEASAESDDDLQNGPNSFSSIDPGALHAYFGIPDDPKGVVSPANVPPEALGPRAGCPAPLVVDLKPGQMLYLPVSWWHEVTSWSDEVSNGSTGAPSGDGQDDERRIVPHQAISWWVHPPTALKEGIAMPPLWTDETQDAGATGHKKADGKPNGGAGSAGAAQASNAPSPASRTVGTSAQPYVDFEVWDEIRRAVNAFIKKSRADAEREAIRAKAEDEEDVVF